MVFQCVSPHWAVLRRLGPQFMVLPGTCVSALGFSFGPSQPVGGNVFLCLVPPSSPLPRWQGPVLGLSRLGRHLRKPLDWVVRFTSSLPATPRPLLVRHATTFHATQCACQITSRHHSIFSQTAQCMRSLFFITIGRYPGHAAFLQLTPCS